jgi:hypothetical protein
MALFHQERIETVVDDTDLEEVYNMNGTCLTSLARALAIICW